VTSEVWATAQSRAAASGRTASRLARHGEAGQIGQFWRPTLFYSIDRTYFGHKLRQSAADRNAFNSAGTGTLMPLEIARVSVRTSRGRVRSALSRYNAPRWANAFACQWRSLRSRKVPRLPTRRRSPPQVASGCSAIRRARSGPLPTPGCHYGGHRGPDVDRPVAPCRNPHLCQLRHEIRDGQARAQVGTARLFRTWVHGSYTLTVVDTVRGKILAVHRNGLQLLELNRGGGLWDPPYRHSGSTKAGSA
jgi:hypothetical protein